LIAGDAFGFPLTGDLLIESIDDAFQLLCAIQWVCSGFVISLPLTSDLRAADAVDASPSLSHTQSCAW
jgi:hypothetical protein